MLAKSRNWPKSSAAYASFPFKRSQALRSWILTPFMNMKTTLPVLFGFLLWAAPTTQAQFKFTTNDGTITITGYTGTAAAVIIPSSISGLPVTSIGQQALFFGSMSSVTIPGSVTYIGGYAFEYLLELAECLFRGQPPHVLEQRDPWDCVQR